MLYTAHITQNFYISCLSSSCGRLRFLINKQIVEIQAVVAGIALAKQYPIPVQHNSLKAFFILSGIWLAKQDIIKCHVIERYINMP